MRRAPKIAVALLAMLAISVLAPAVSANDLLVGKFSLPHPTVWNSVLLPSGDYTLRMESTVSNTNLLFVRGQGKTIQLPIFQNDACASCQRGALNLQVQGEQVVVSSLDLPGFHVDFGVHQSKSEREHAAKNPQSEQVVILLAAR